MSTPGRRVADRANVALQLAFRGRHLLLLDVLAIVAAFLGSFALRFDVPSVLFSEYAERFFWLIAPLLVLRIGVFIAAGLYQRVWRYASIAELQAIVLAVVASGVIGYGAVYLAADAVPALRGFPRSIPVIDTLLLLAIVGGLRFSFLMFGVGRRGAGPADKSGRALVVGAGTAGVAVAKQVLSDPRAGLRLVGFVDDHETRGHRLLGLPVLGSTADLQVLIRDHGVGTVLFALPTADGSTLRRLVRLAEREGARSLTVPSLSEVLSGQVSSAIREVQVDDLLRRAPAKIDLESVRESFADRIVLVTGAGGTIGSELSRQLVRYGPKHLYLLGRGENSIYEVMETLREARTAVPFSPVILNIENAARVRDFVRAIRPDAIFHAAAHKHVTFMERFPAEAIATNVLGTLNLLGAAEDSDVETFVFVSTDKAVRPANVMGATKRLGELLVRDAARRTGRRYVVVRFGNVLSSRGSVLPRFRRQLASGGPLTVSHPQVRRYFMTAAESVQLILQAAAIGQGGQTFVLDMGEPVLIEDLARDLIEMNGMVPGRDIEIAYSGLEPGEKLSEELFLPDERPARTAHENLWATEDPAAARPTDEDAIAELRAAAERGDPALARALLERLVPEYERARGAANLALG